MVTDNLSRLISPAGKEFARAACRFAGIHPGSHVLDLGAGYGEDACTVASEFRCRITAIEKNKEYIEYGRSLAISKQVSHLITFRAEDFFRCDYAENAHDLILAQGGAFNAVGRGRSLACLYEQMPDRAWFAFSDFIFLSENPPHEVFDLFAHESGGCETEKSYRGLLQNTGFSIHFVCLVPQSGWDNYYAHIARRLEDQNGIFSDPRIKICLHKEIDIFYRLKAHQHIGRLFCICRKET
jgi:SAM-dependent methyltransferase